MKASDQQIGGNHYKRVKYQHFDFVSRWGLPWGLSNALKYLCRYKNKNGAEDLDKALHYIKLYHEYTSSIDLKNIIKKEDITNFQADCKEFSLQFVGVLNLSQFELLLWLDAVNIVLMSVEDNDTLDLFSLEAFEENIQGLKEKL